MSLSPSPARPKIRHILGNSQILNPQCVIWTLEIGVWGGILIWGRLFAQKKFDVKKLIQKCLKGLWRGPLFDILCFFWKKMDAFLEIFATISSIFATFVLIFFFAEIGPQGRFISWGSFPLHFVTCFHVQTRFPNSPRIGLIFNTIDPFIHRNILIQNHIITSSKSGYITPFKANCSI